MNGTRVDTISRFLANRRDRRLALASGFGVAATAVTAHSLAAQDATPNPDEVITDPHPSADGAITPPEMMFVQWFAGGTWTPGSTDDTYTLTLSGASAQTIYFSDRPDRIFGQVPTQEFFALLGITEANPPNAALLADGSMDGQEVLVVELLDPAYDESAETLTYTARMLADYAGRGLADAAVRQEDHTLPETFAAGGLFIDGIDDCHDTTYRCSGPATGKFYGTVEVGNCFNWDGIASSKTGCFPCRSPEHFCGEAYPQECVYRVLDDQGNLIGIGYTCKAEKA